MGWQGMPLTTSAYTALTQRSHAQLTALRLSDNDAVHRVHGLPVPLPV